MTIVLIVIAVLLFLIADHLGVFSKNHWTIPVGALGLLAYFYPLTAAGIAAVVGVVWGGF